VYLDSGATALKPQVVLDKMMEYYTEYSANIHRGNYGLSIRATEEYELARKKVADFLKASDIREISFCKNATEGFNMVAGIWENLLHEGDIIVTTVLEHHSNFVPWQRLASHKKMKFEILKFKEDESLDMDNVDWGRVKILALTQVSNVTGQVLDVQEIIKIAKNKNPNLIVVVDGCQAVAHMMVDVVKMDCDYYIFSGHKLYGPTGVGVVWSRLEHTMVMDPFLVGGGMIGKVGDTETTWAEPPEKYEAGTPPIAEVIGLGSAIDFVSGFDWQEVESYEKYLMEYTKLKLGENPKVKVFCGKNSRSVISFVVEGVHAHDVGEILNRYGVCVRTGHHCTQPLHRALGVAATTRVSFGIYNTKEDVDKLTQGLLEVIKIFNL